MKYLLVIINIHGLFYQIEMIIITIDKYEDNFFGKYKIVQLLFRTSSSNEFKQIKHKEKTNLIADKNGGTLILHANVDYEDGDNNPKGNVQLKIKGGK